MTFESLATYIAHICLKCAFFSCFFLFVFLPLLTLHCKIPNYATGKGFHRQGILCPRCQDLVIFDFLYWCALIYAWWFRFVSSCEANLTSLIHLVVGMMNPDYLKLCENETFLV